MYDFSLTRLANLPSQEHFVHNRVNLVEVEDKIKFTHVVEVLIENFHKVVYRFQRGQVIVAYICAYAKVEARIAAVDDLKVSELNKVGVLGVAHCHYCMNLLNQLLLLIIVKLHIP